MRGFRSDVAKERRILKKVTKNQSKDSKKINEALENSGFSALTYVRIRTYEY